MILTGKAKEDFIDYLWQSKFNKDDYKEYEDYIDNQKESHTYADIIEWFDSVGIYIEIVLCCGLFDFIVDENISDVKIGYTTREYATKQAIIKANKIYNDR